MLRLDDDHHALLWQPGLLGRRITAKVLLRRGVDKFEVAIFIATHDDSANLKRTIGISEIGESDRDARLAQDVPILLAFLIECEEEMLAVPGEPHRAHLWLPFRPDGR